MASCFLIKEIVAILVKQKHLKLTALFLPRMWTNVFVNEGKTIAPGVCSQVSSQRWLQGAFEVGWWGRVASWWSTRWDAGCRVSLGMLGGGVNVGFFCASCQKKARAWCIFNKTRDIERDEEIFGRVPPFFLVEFWACHLGFHGHFLFGKSSRCFSPQFPRYLAPHGWPTFVLYSRRSYPLEEWHLRNATREQVARCGRNPSYR